MLFKKREEEPTFEPATEKDVIDVLDIYVRQVIEDFNFGVITEEEYEQKRKAINEGMEKIRKLMPDPDFDWKVHQVLDEIMGAGNG